MPSEPITLGQLIKFIVEDERKNHNRQIFEIPKGLGMMFDETYNDEQAAGANETTIVATYRFPCSLIFDPGCDKWFVVEVLKSSRENGHSRIKHLVPACLDFLVDSEESKNLEDSGTKKRRHGSLTCPGTPPKKMAEVTHKKPPPTPGKYGRSFVKRPDTSCAETEHVKAISPVLEKKSPNTDIDLVEGYVAKIAYSSTIPLRDERELQRQSEEQNRVVELTKLAHEASCEAREGDVSPKIKASVSIALDSTGQNYRINTIIDFMSGVDCAVYLQGVSRHPSYILYFMLNILFEARVLQEQKIVHGNLKPEHFIITRNCIMSTDEWLESYWYRIIDFKSAGMERAPGVIYTPQYAAPELFAGKGITVAADDFSMGVILAETFKIDGVFECRGKEIVSLTQQLADLRAKDSVNYAASAEYKALIEKLMQVAANVPRIKYEEVENELRKIFPQLGDGSPVGGGAATLLRSMIEVINALTESTVERRMGVNVAYDKILYIKKELQQLGIIARQSSTPQNAAAPSAELFKAPSSGSSSEVSEDGQSEDEVRKSVSPPGAAAAASITSSPTSCILSMLFPSAANEGVALQVDEEDSSLCRQLNPFFD